MASPSSYLPGPGPGAGAGTPRRNVRTALRWWRIAAILLLAFFLVVDVPAFLPRSTPSLASPTSSEGVTFRTDASASEIAAAGAQLLEGYGAFSVARGPASALALLAAAGRYASALPDASFLHVTTGDVDVRTLAATDTRAWPSDGSGEAVGIVHFYAPIKPAWTRELEARGLQALLYVPTDALLVRGSAAAVAGLTSLPYVDWSGPVESAWKMPASLVPATGVPDVRIVVLPGEPANAVVAWLAHAGVPPHATDAASAGIAGAYGAGDFQWVRARVPAALIPGLASLPEVQYIDPVVPVRTLNYATDWILQTNVTGSYRYWNANLNGTGQFIGIADTGVDYDNSQFRQSGSRIVTGDLYNVTDPTRRKIVRYLDEGVLTGQLTWPGQGGAWDPYSIADCAFDPTGQNPANGHGTAVTSTLAGNAYTISSDLNNGNALAAQIYMEDIGGLAAGTTCTNGGEQLIYVPQDYADLFGPPGLGYNDPLAPVRIQSDSWGSPGNAYDVQAWMVDSFVWQHPDFAMFFAAGNDGPNAGTIDSPGTAKDVVTVGGACNPDLASSDCLGNQGDLAGFSSRGPTQDGRLKPDLLTLADGYSATSDGNPLSCGNVASCTMPADHGWAGTSYATPAAAAAAAIIRQYFGQGWYPSRAPVAADAFDPSAALIRAMLLASGQQIAGAGTTATMWPNAQQGFGRILLSKILPLVGDGFDTQVVDNTAGLLTGDAMTYTFHVVSGAAAARFVLAWTDYPGTLGASTALVNDLDLQVTAPNGTVYRGNNFGSASLGASVPGGTFDATNPEEAVLLKSPAAGDWTVNVIGANVPEGPQPFALVATGGLDPNYGRITLDKPVYSEADTIHIRVDDANAASASVQVASSLEPAGETVTLTQAAPGAPWLGSLPTAFGQPVAGDGILQVRGGDTITVTYVDASPVHTAVDTAKVRVTSPAISNVYADAIDATSAEIRWTTDLSGSSEVVYGTNPANLSASVTRALLETSHAVLLQGLQADTPYTYEVVSKDALGHVTRDTNGGRQYAFRTAPWGDVLLVIGDSTFPAVREVSYAAAFQTLGWTWSVWRAADLGLPPLSVLQGRRAVVWQVGLEEYPTFNTSAQALVKAYLDGGGRLLVFSHDTSWSLGSTASPWYNASNVNWLRGVLKATFECDPTSITSVVGVAGDPVSGPFTSGVTYTPHRTGGADDEIAPASLGGTSGTAWRDGGVSGCPGNAPIGLEWISAANNGTPGVGAWGGTPTRLEYFAFELTSVDTNATDLRPSSPVRAEILDNALRWLVGLSTTALDREHPNVTLVAPSVGTFTGSAITVNWTASATGPGIGLGSFDLAYSPDGGQTWVALPTAPGTARSATWDLSGVQNGDAYRVRILAHDNGTPSLTGASESNATFAINRTGGDTLGPVIRAGSLRIAPDPPGSAEVSWINATADDARSGGSAIAAAELFWSAGPPTAANGTGIPMGAADGSFDRPVENLTFTGGFDVAPGTTCAWVHARDAAGNWGPFNRTCVTVLNLGPDTLPPAPAALASLALVNAGTDLQLTWGKAWDDRLFGGTVRYQVWRASSPTRTYVDVSGNLTATGALTYAYVDAGRGSTDPTESFYRVETYDAANNTALSPAIAAKLWRPTASGLNLVGMGVDPGSAAIASMTGTTPWSAAWTYDACSGGFGWTRVTPTGGGTLPLAAGRGFWFNATAVGKLLVLGIADAQVTVRLCAGWNLVALPGFLANVTVASVKAATGADLVEGFDPNGAYHLQVLDDAAPIATGAGYWVRVSSDVLWTVAGW